MSQFSFSRGQVSRRPALGKVGDDDLGVIVVRCNS
jgi:hypothetical protein